MSGGASSNASIAYSFDIPDLLGYSPNGNLLLVNDSVMGNWTYGYDNLNRLVSGFASSGPYHDTNSAWTYDGFGNRTSEISPISNSSATYTYGSNQVASSTTSAAGYLYDAAGDVQYDGLNYYLYDAEGRVCAVKNYVGTVTGYIYDAAGIRVAKANLNQFSCNLAYDYTVTDSYVLGLGGEQITEFTVNGGVSTWAHTNVFNGGGLLATYSPTGNSTGSTLPGGSVRTSTYFALNDWLGTKRAEVGANGCVSTYASMPFGGGLSASGNCTDPTEHHFTGKERDAESGLDYFGARYYASNMGRWMSPDWADKPEAVPYSSLGDPQSLNLYAYVRNNPIGSADADGHCDWCQRMKNFLGGDGWKTNSQIKPTVSTTQGDGIAIMPKWMQTLQDVGDVGMAIDVAIMPSLAPEQEMMETMEAVESESMEEMTSSAEQRTYQTYTKTNAETGEVCSGRTSGTGTPQENVAARDSGHVKTKEGFGPAQLDKSSSNPAAIRGREQQLIDANGGPKNSGGTSGNQINGVSPKNPNAGAYKDAAKKEFGSN